jgi:DHA1 family tetracycline resistance protein-like MFS transporter
MTVSQAYISDVTSPQDRTKIYGYSSAVFGAGLIFGPLIGGTLSTINYSIPMFFAAGISLISIILVILFLPESLSLKKENSKIKFNDIIPLDDAKRFFKDSNVRNVLLLFFIYSFGFMLFISSFALFAKEQVQVTAQELGFLMAWIGILRVIFQSLLINPLQKKFGENSALSIGIISMILTMVILAFTTNYIFAYIPLIFLAFGTGVCRPILTSKLTKSVNKEETGSVLGVNNALSSIGQIIAPILGGAMILYLPSFFLPALSAIFFVIMFIQWIKGSKN